MVSLGLAEATAAGAKSPASEGGGPVRPTLVIPSSATLLLVLHDFESRSPDELTLRKGEHVELLEKDGT